MVNIILIDDEEPALLEMEYLLKQYPEINIAGKYTNSLEAMEGVELLKPDAIFIDINMPQLTGMEFAKRLQNGRKDMDVIFVTAYEQYAVEAFRVEATDYLLKPVFQEHLDQTVTRLLGRRTGKVQNTERLLELRTLGEQQIGWAGCPPLKWRTEKEKELFAFLLNSGGRQISRDRIINELWGEYEADRAVRQLHNAIYYVKKTLKDYGIGQELLHISGHYKLKLGEVWYDRAIIEKKMENLKGLQTLEELEEILALFTGAYHQFEGWTWLEPERELLNRYEMELLTRISQKCRETGIAGKAEQALKKAFYNNPFDENITSMLLELYGTTGETVKATKHYLEYQKRLEEELGISPHKNITKLYSSIQSDK